MNSDSEAEREQLLAFAAAAPGFLPDTEAAALYLAARSVAGAGLGPLLEVGAYLGRSTLFLAAALPGSGEVLYSVDHHRGSEEMQAGWEHHDPSLVEEASGRIETLGRWRTNIVAAGAEAFVIGVIGPSARVASNWGCPLALLFIDGGHDEAVCRSDYLGFSPFLSAGGLLVFHDIYPEGLGGGEGPWRCYREALASGEFAALPDASVGSLQVLRRLGEKSALVALPPASRSRASNAAAAE